jgi:hypothetical protein
MSKIPIEKVKIIKELGHGIMGTVYLVEYKGKNYALKIEHIFDEDIDDKTSPTWNEILFAENLANKYPEQFMFLYNYDFINNCELKQKYAADLSYFPETKQNFLKKLSYSPFCVRKIYSLVDSTLNKVKLNNLQERYSMIIQLLYILFLLESNNYVHSDFHPGNVGVVNTKKKYLNILGHQVPTYGRLYQAIDYGGVLNKDTMDPDRKIMGMEETQAIVYEWAKINDKLPALMINVNDKDFWDYVNDNNIKLDQEVDKAKVFKLPEMEIIKNIVDDDILQFELLRIMYPEQFQKTVLGKKYKKVLPWKFEIPFDDVLFYFLNFQDTKLLLEYFIEKLETLNQKTSIKQESLSDLFLESLFIDFQK